jgi:hypothetical protein
MLGHRSAARSTIVRPAALSCDIAPQYLAGERVLLFSVRLGIHGPEVSDLAGRSWAGGGLTRVPLVVLLD